MMDQDLAVMPLENIAPEDEEAALAQGRERLERLGERDGAAPVQQVQVEIIRLQALQAVFAGRDRVAAARVRRQHLADDIDLIAPAGDGLRNELLGAAVAVHLGGVDEVGAEVEARAQRLLLGRALVLVLADLPRALAEPRDGRAVR